MIIELNIGLNVTNGDNSDEFRAHRATTALKALACGAYTQNILGSRRAQSGTEDTLIVKLSVSSGSEQRLRQELFGLSEFLLQDCIAVYNATGWSGELVGPNAAAWGEFNPEFFRSEE